MEGLDSIDKTLLVICFRVDTFSLYYVICEVKDSDYTTILQYFLDKYVVCAPHNGSYYDADERTVHQFFTLFTHGHTSKGWFKPVAQLKDRRHYLLALSDQFSGEETHPGATQYQRGLDNHFIVGERYLCNLSCFCQNNRKCLTFLIIRII